MNEEPEENNNNLMQISDKKKFRMMSDLLAKNRVEWKRKPHKGDPK